MKGGLGNASIFTTRPPVYPIGQNESKIRKASLALKNTGTLITMTAVKDWLRVLCILA
jgi:hypothetical protein